jgi:hypothetical protein
MKFSSALDAFVDIFICGACGCSIDETSFDEVTEVLSETCDIDAVDKTTVLKSVFLESDVPEVRPHPKHTHGKSAAVRSTAGLLVDRISLVSGLEVVYVQGSAADVRKGRRVTRSWFWAKDFMASPSRLMDGDAYAMIDVDYYVDMNSWLCKRFAPHFLYTFVPNRACKDSGEYKYTFNSDGTVVYDVSGGGHYEHQVWNWSGDALRVEKRNWFGFINQVAFYAVERRFMDDDHQLVLLAPLKRYTGVFRSYCARHLVQARALERYNPVSGDFIRMRVNEGENMLVSTGRVGGYSCSVTPARVDDAIVSANNTLARNITLATVKSKMSDGEAIGGDSRKYPGCEVLLEHHLSGQRLIQTTLSGAVRRFQWVPRGSSVDDDSTPGMVAFMLPLYDGAFVPDKCRGNDIRAAEERVVKLRAQDAEVDEFTLECMKEFANFLVGEHRGLLKPVENDIVYERQNKPSQRRILDEAQHGQRTDKAMNFVKREAYQKVNDPRMISQINGVDKMEYSAYVYAFADVIKIQPWYAFSKTPLEVALRVVEIAEDAEWLDNTDFSRMDGRVGNAARLLEQIVMFLAFRKEYHLELHALMRNQYCLRGVMNSGMRYDTGLARSSGSPETSAFNTMLCAFVKYLAFRRMRDVMGGWYTPQKAWNSLGIYGGDDGLTAGLGRSEAGWAARAMGQKLELERTPRGNIGVSFLARHYGPDVWFGDPTSCCDIARQLSKFHVTVHLPGNISPVDKLREKAFAFSLTDRNTPVIGDFVTKALKEFPLTSSGFKNILNVWNLELDPENQYPNSREDWMLDLLMEQIPEFDLGSFDDWVSSARGMDLLHPPGFAPRPKPSAKPGLVVVDDDLFGEQEEEKTEDRQDTEVNSKIEKKRTLYRARKPKRDRPSRKISMNSST